jgi:hypothetical protein
MSTKSKQPVVFMFQLADYIIVKNKQLVEWEAALINRVKMNKRVAASLVELATASTITATFSRTSPANGQFDDCDQD